jgi:hypothetical protein
MATVPNGSLIMVGSDGGVFSIGQAEFFGSLSGQAHSPSIVAIAADPGTGGYWLAGRDGGIYAMHAGYYGSLGHVHLTSPIVAMAATPDGRGYWLASADGGVFAFGDARYAGSAAAHHLASPIVGMAATPDGRGYWLTSADGGVFAFGDARYAGSAAAHHPTSPIVAMAADHSGRGYWLMANDGGVFTFGDARYYGSASSLHGHSLSSFVPAPDGRGYWMVGHNGTVFAYGSARPVDQAVPPVVPATVSMAASSRPTMASGRIQAAGRVAKRRQIIRSDVTEYKHRDTGFDISQYQCTTIPRGHPGIAVVQVTGGALDNAPNPCYRAEAAWGGKNLSAYLYMSGVPSPPTHSTLVGPAGHCSAADTVCQGYNYGYNYARYWVAYSDSQGVMPKLWWLDVENYSGWTNPPTNSAIIRGALDAFRSMHQATGIYSTPSQWNGITGGMNIRGEAEWTPGAGNVAGGQYSAQGFCRAAATHTFGGGHLKLVQYGYQGPFPDSYSGPPQPYDQDYACP